MINAITRIRNEAHIIKDTLDHVGSMVDGIYVIDDFSEDETVEICKAHPKVKLVIEKTSWDPTPDGRRNAEATLRTQIYQACLHNNPDWVYYFDADEFASFDGIDWTADAYRLRLWDYYITEEDKNLTWKERQWIGPEYRDILMLFRPQPHYVFTEREPDLHNINIQTAGEVKHYGKAISIEEWEKTCDYYINHRGGDKYPKFTEKWQARKGKAVHNLSDFGAHLIKWEDRHKGFKLQDL